MSASALDSAKSLKVFISYALADNDWYQKLAKHLMPLQRLGLITSWSQEHIEAGKERAAELRQLMDAAQIILLLISPAFIASDQCYRIEMGWALERRASGAARVIPVLLEPVVGWEHLPFGEVAPLPTNGKPIATWPKRAPALSAVVSGIRTVAQGLLNQQGRLRTNYHASIVDQPPPCSPDTHIQRTSLIKQIYRQFTQPGVNAIALTGMGGTGKTIYAALLYQYAESERLQGRGPFTSKTLWLNIQASTTVVDLISTLREASGKSPLDCSNLTAKDLARELLKTLNNEDNACLVILNQFEAFLDPQTRQALVERPGIGEWLDMLNEWPCAWRVVLTSRFSPRGTYASASMYLREYRVPDFSTDEGIALLRLRGVRATEAELYLAVKRCQGHALALVLLQDLLKDHSVTRIATFFNDPRFAAERIDAMARELFAYMFTQQLNQDQRDLLLAFAVYREPAPLEAAQAVMDASIPMPIQRFMAALRVLLNQHLLQQSAELRYQLHSLVAEFAREHIDDQQTLYSAHARAAQYYHEQYNQQQARSRYRLGNQRRSRGGVHDLIESIWHYCHAGQQQQAYELIVQENIFQDLLRWGDNSTLLELYLSLLPSETWQPAPEQTARIYNEAGEIYQVLGQREKAWQCFEQSLQYCRVLARSRTDMNTMVHALNNLGVVYRRQGEIEKALQCYQEAKNIADGAKGESTGRGTTLNNIGYAYYQLGRKTRNQGQTEHDYERALYYYQQALSLHRAEGNRGEEARTLDNLGKIYYALGQRDEAYEYYQQALDLAQEQEDRWVEATVLHDLGECAREFADALEYYRQAYHIYHEIGARADEAISLKNIGYLHLFQKEEQRKYDIILACFMQADAILSELEGCEPSEIPPSVRLECELALGEQRLQELLKEVAKQTVLIHSIDVF